MEVEVDELPSAEINSKNCMDRIKECVEYMNNMQWSQFTFLFHLFISFSQQLAQDSEAIETEFSQEVQKIQDTAISIIIKQLEAASTFEDFQSWLYKLSDVVQDRKALWDLMYTEMQASIKVTLRQSHEIAAAFFTPSMLFEYGIEAFLSSSLFDFSNIANEEALIDIFYGLAGFVRACNMEPTYETNNQSYFDFINKLLTMFTDLPDFDAHRFVWLVEAVNDHLHLPSQKMREICHSVLAEFVNREGEKQTLLRLHKLCIISTSPFMQSFAMVRDSINHVFALYIEEQRFFVRRYIFSCFATIEWDGRATGELSEPLRCWKLFLTNLASRLTERSELPGLIMVDFLDDSLTLFEGYYGEVQPSEDKSKDLRMDLFAIVELITQYYPGDLGEDTLRRLWFLLYIVAVSGASQEEIDNVQPLDSPAARSPFLGLERSGTDFADYGLALGMLNRKFETEEDSFMDFVHFIRENFK